MNSFEAQLDIFREFWSENAWNYDHSKTIVPKVLL